MTFSNVDMRFGRGTFLAESILSEDVDESLTNKFSAIVAADHSEITDINPFALHFVEPSAKFERRLVFGFGDLGPRAAGIGIDNN